MKSLGNKAVLPTLENKVNFLSIENIQSSNNTERLTKTNLYGKKFQKYSE